MNCMLIFIIFSNFIFCNIKYMYILSLYGNMSQNYSESEWRKNLTQKKAICQKLD